MTPAIVGLACVTLGLILGVSSLIRHHIRVLQRLHLPAAIIGGFVTLLTGPQVLGHLIGGDGIFPDGVLDVWTTLPGLLINVVFGALLIGKPLPAVRRIWSLSAPHVITGALLSFGQFALASLTVLLLLGPLFGLPPEAGALLEMSFAGGHGTVAGLQEQLRTYRVEELADLGLGLATLALTLAVVVGSVLVGLSKRHSPAMQRTPVPDLDIGRVSQDRNDPPDPAHISGLSALTSAIVFISVAIVIGLVIQHSVRWLEQHLTASTFLEHLPLFPLTLIGGAVVQILARSLRYEQFIDLRMVSDVSGAALDMLLVSAIGTMSLTVIGHEAASVVILTVVGTAWSIFVFRYLGSRVFPSNGFVHASADFGQSMGNVATGLVLVDMMDPEEHTQARLGYAYKQLAYQPFFGGGLVTALAVPFIAVNGLLLFGIGTTIVTVVLALWGMRRARSRARTNAGDL